MLEFPLLSTLLVYNIYSYNITILKLNHLFLVISSTVICKGMWLQYMQSQYFHLHIFYRTLWCHRTNTLINVHVNCDKNKDFLRREPIWKKVCCGHNEYSRVEDNNLISNGHITDTLLKRIWMHIDGNWVFLWNMQLMNDWGCNSSLM